MSEICKNTQPISIEEFLERINKKVHQMKYYSSIYITPTGEILDCGYPESLGHNEFCEKVYASLDALPEKPFNSCLRTLGVPFKEIPYYLEDYHNLLDVQYEDMKLFWTIDKVLLGTEDRICQDMGFVKVAINNRLKTFEVVIPNSIFGKNVTAHQKDILEKLSDFFMIDLIGRLKSEQKENAAIASKIQQTLDKIHGQNV